MIAGVRECVVRPGPTTLRTAAVSIAVRGHSELAAMPSSRSSSLNPRVTRLIPNLAIVYAVAVENHLGSRVMGGDSVRTWALSAAARWSMHDLASRNDPRELMS